jgi:hypothetical protein
MDCLGLIFNGGCEDFAPALLFPANYDRSAAPGAWRKKGYDLSLLSEILAPIVIPP